MLKSQQKQRSSSRTCNEINSRSCQLGMAFPYKWDWMSIAYFSPSQVYFGFQKTRFWASCFFNY